MNPISADAVKLYVKQNIRSFHDAKLEALRKLKLDHILRQKNPYLFKAKNISLAQDLVRSLLDAFLSSQEEGIFGDFLEALAVFVNQEAYGGKKSAAQGIDLEFDKDGIRYIVNVKSGPNWGNSGQIREMNENFNRAKKIIRARNKNINVQAV